MSPSRFLLLAASALTPEIVSAQGLPDPRFSTLDPVAVGSPSGVAIGGSPPGFDVVVRDVNNAPRPGVAVSLRFGAAGVRLYATQQSGTTIDCAQGWLTRITDAQGHVNFVPKFGGWNDGNVVQVFAGDESLGSVKARSPDYDKDGRVALPDFVIFSDDFLTHPATLRSDFDVLGTVGLGDFAIFSDQFVGASTAQPLCP